MIIEKNHIFNLKMSSGNKCKYTNFVEHPVSSTWVNSCMYCDIKNNIQCSNCKQLQSKNKKDPFPLPDENIFNCNDIFTFR